MIIFCCYNQLFLILLLILVPSLSLSFLLFFNCYTLFYFDVANI
nr:MAG TPA: hypothetical protein [Caudoviricetes sp.]